MKQDAAPGLVSTTSDSLVHEQLPGGSIRVTVRGPASQSSWPILDCVLVAIVAALCHYLASNQLSVDGIRSVLIDLHWTSLVGALIVVLYVLTRPARILSESVTFTPALGIQLTTTTQAASFLLAALTAPKRSTVFIPRDKILDLYIGEGFNRFSILDYLAVSIAVEGHKGRAGGARIRRLFPHLQPRLPVLIEAYNILYHHLFPSTAPT